MPARYEAMRDKFDKTMGHDAAQTKAAKIYNSTKKSSDPALHGGKKKSRATAEAAVSKRAKERGIKGFN